MNGKIKMELENGKEVELALNFASLYKIRGLKKDVYDRYNKVIMKGTEDTFDTVTVLYTAYLCANVDNLDECMGEMEFMENLPYNPPELARKCNELISAKKRRLPISIHKSHKRKKEK